MQSTFLPKNFSQGRFKDLSHQTALKYMAPPDSAASQKKLTTQIKHFIVLIVIHWLLLHKHHIYFVNENII